MWIILWLLRSSRAELAIVLSTLTVLILLPAFAVVAIASSGIQIVGDALAAVNPITRLVEIFDPSGKKVAELPISSTWPARGYISDEFGTWDGWRKAQGFGPHNGIDIAHERGMVGEPITPFTVGTVVYTNNTVNGDCGKAVKLDHGNSITSLYCHLDSAVTLPAGTQVKPGDLIGYMGSTGASTGPHLHFMILVFGVAVNPRTFLTGEPVGTYASTSF
jgi:murein DD-endopeptidase MepM/ murein hydrolase activator NlpD